MNTNFQMDASHQQHYDNELLISKLSHSVRVSKYLRHGIPTPIIIADGCPFDWITFNLLICHYASGRSRTLGNINDDNLCDFWESVNYQKPTQSVDVNNEISENDYQYIYSQLIKCWEIKNSPASLANSDCRPNILEIQSMISDVIPAQAVSP